MNGEHDFAVVYLCLGDKWQDWQERGFANRTASVARELMHNPRVRRLIIVNNPTSYGAVLAGRARERISVWKGPFGHFIEEIEDIEESKGIEETGENEILDICRRVVEEQNSAYDNNMHENEGRDDGRQGTVKNRATVVEQIRLLPKERSNALAFSVNNAIYDRNLVRTIKGVLKGTSEDTSLPTILWMNSPVFAKFAGLFDEDLVVYDARDDWVHHPQLKPIRRELERGYRRIHQKADIVFTVSKSLAETFGGGRPEVFLVPNGINPQLFDGDKKFSEPSILAAIPRPVVGYVGKMQDRFDVRMMAEVAGSLPDVSFVLVGPVFTPEVFEPLKRFSNIIFTGRIHQSQIPSFVSHFDVCMMPHVSNRLTMAMNPLKIYEYLALGKPTVCSDVSGLDQFDGLVEIASDAETFKNKILDALSEHPSKKQARIDFACRQKWSERVQCMVKEIDRKLCEKALKNDK